jgi:hypothetical protein
MTDGLRQPVCAPCAAMIDSRTSPIGCVDWCLRLQPRPFENAGHFAWRLTLPSYCAAAIRNLNYTKDLAQRQLCLVSLEVYFYFSSYPRPSSLFIFVHRALHGSLSVKTWCSSWPLVRPEAARLRPPQRVI